MRKVISAASAAVLSLGLLVATPGLAQVELGQSVVNGLTELGIDPEGWVLTEEQVLQLENVLNSDDSEDEKRAQIEAIVGEQ